MTMAVLPLRDTPEKSPIILRLIVDCILCECMPCLFNALSICSGRHELAIYPFHSPHLWVIVAIDEYMSCSMDVKGSVGFIITRLGNRKFISNPGN